MKEFVGLRIDSGLLAQIDDAAEKDNRTRTDMIRHVLIKTFERRGEVNKQARKKAAGE
jgi:hypothetical protein